MESIDRLRSVVFNIRLLIPKSLVTTYCDKEGEILDYDVRRALGMATDEIERELKERYIELPVDANDVPIKVGDRLTDGKYVFEVDGISYNRYGGWSIWNKQGSAWDCCDVEHVPDPVTKLKSCPFCGSKDLYIIETMIGRDAPFMSADDKTVGIFCNTCKQKVILEENEDEGRNLNTERRAVEAWNRRVGQ